MRKVFTKSQDVIELWAGNSQDEARMSGRSVYFNDKKKIYSYGSHYLLAEFITDDFTTVMINDTGWSRTTARHVKEVTAATTGNKQFFKSETDFETVFRNIKGNNDKLKKARKPKIYIDRILYLWEKLHEYVRYKESRDTIFFPGIEYGEVKRIVDSITHDAVEYSKEEEETSIKELQKLLAM